MSNNNKFIDIVFDGPPGHESGRFVEVEDADLRSIAIGEWVYRGDGLWALRIDDPRELRMLMRDAQIQAEDRGQSFQDARHELAIVNELLVAATKDDAGMALRGLAADAMRERDKLRAELTAAESFRQRVIVIVRSTPMDDAGRIDSHITASMFALLEMING